MNEREAFKMGVRSGSNYAGDVREHIVDARKYLDNFSRDYGCWVHLDSAQRSLRKAIKSIDMLRYIHEHSFEIEEKRARPSTQTEAAE